MTGKNYTCSRCGILMHLPTPPPGGGPILCSRCSNPFVAAPLKKNAGAQPDNPRRSRSRSAPSASPGHATDPLAASLGDPDWDQLQRQQRKRMFSLTLILVGGLLSLLGILAIVSAIASNAEEDKNRQASTKERDNSSDKKPALELPGFPPEREFPPLKDRRPGEGRPPRRVEEEEPGAGENWRADPELLDELATATEVAPYRVRPPVRYRLAPPTRSDTPRTWTWDGPQRRDLTSAMFSVALRSVRADEAERSLTTILRVVLEDLQRRREDWSQEPVQHGTIDGLTFVRTRWHGRQVGSGELMHGFVYVGRDGDTLIQLRGQDVSPHHRTSLELATAAALTFRKP